MLLLDLRNSNQPTTQGGWRYTPCGNKICSRTYIGFADTCPIPTSSGIDRTPRMRSSPMLMPRRLVYYARLAYMVKTGRHQRTGTVTDHRGPMLRCHLNVVLVRWYRIPFFSNFLYHTMRCLRHS